MPKYLYELTTFKGILSYCISKDGSFDSLDLLPKTITLVLSVLALIPLALHHRERAFRSSCRSVMLDSKLLMAVYRTVSSAYNATLQF